MLDIAMNPNSLFVQQNSRSRNASVSRGGPGTGQRTHWLPHTAAVCQHAALVRWMRWQQAAVAAPHAGIQCMRAVNSLRRPPSRNRILLSHPL